MNMSRCLNQNLQVDMLLSIHGFESISNSLELMTNLLKYAEVVSFTGIFYMYEELFKLVFDLYGWVG